eukprot:TRINITY_DN5405_c0_g1_i1.p1 TRINITY_DN5405_c0_g1~~TRINITY_DN5405_c0_g1_i1.p1  ORF type:complete len:132 (-),score=7.29 TRINITY_DN5405_c0_g1_i1:79-474(-)
MTIHLILGGARSGKSSFAEKQAVQYETSVKSHIYYLATAQSLDGEMSARIKQHQLQRPSHWPLIESPIELANALKNIIAKHQSEHKETMTVLVTVLRCGLVIVYVQPEIIVGSKRNNYSLNCCHNNKTKLA